MDLSSSRATDIKKGRIRDGQTHGTGFFYGSEFRPRGGHKKGRIRDGQTHGRGFSYGSDPIPRGGHKKRAYPGWIRPFLWRAHMYCRTRQPQVLLDQRHRARLNTVSGGQSVQVQPG